MRALWSVSAILVVAAGSVFAAPMEVPCNTDVAGRIAGIQVGGVSASSVGENQIRIIRRQTSQRVQNGMPLCAGDQISVLGDTVLVMSLGEAEADITVHAVTSFELANSSSIFLRIGKVFATLRGFFEAKTSTATLAARGTEFQVEVTDAGIEVLQLEGEVEITPQESEQAQSKPGEIHLVSMQRERALPAPWKLKRLQRIVVAAPRALSADEERVRKAIDVNANVILSVRPAQPSTSLIPNFDSEKARAAAYREARFQTIWTPGDAGYSEVLGNVYVDWAESRKALVSYAKGGESPPADRDAALYYHNLGTAYRLAGVPGKAREYFVLSRKADPSLVFSYNDEGDLYADVARAAADEGNVEEARKYLERAATLYEKSLDPSLHGWGDATYQATPAYHLGEVALLRAQWTNTSDEIGANLEQAERWFKQALGSDPQSLFARVGLGRISEAAKDVERARAHYDAALKRDSSFAPAYLAMGESYELQRDWEMAVRFFQRATQADPHFPLAYYKTAKALQKSGNPELARNYFGAYVQIESPLMRDGVRVKEAKDAIAKGSGSEEPGPDLPPPPPPPSYVRVPDLTGYSQQQAESRLAAAGLQIGEIQREISDRAAKGTVIRQRPSASRSVNRNAAVDLWISAGPPPLVTVPDLTGATPLQATIALKLQGLSMRQEPIDSGGKAGRIVKQNPPARSRVNRGTEITVYVTSSRRGDDEVNVPNIIKKTADQARAELEKNGLRFEPQYGKAPERSTKAPEHMYVYRQEPLPGKRVPRGSTVVGYIK